MGAYQSSSTKAVQNDILENCRYCNTHRLILNLSLLDKSELEMLKPVASNYIIETNLFGNFASSLLNSPNNVTMLKEFVYSNNIFIDHFKINWSYYPNCVTYFTKEQYVQIAELTGIKDFEKPITNYYSIMLRGFQTEYWSYNHPQKNNICKNIIPYTNHQQESVIVPGNGIISCVCNVTEKIHRSTLNLNEHADVYITGSLYDKIIIVISEFELEVLKIIIPSVEQLAKIHSILT